MTSPRCPPPRQVSPEQAQLCGLGSQRRGRSLLLMARSPQLPPPGTAALRLGWSGRRGQLLVQTDKPIYTPRQRGETLILEGTDSGGERGQEEGS